MKERIIRNTLYSGGSSAVVGVIGFLLLPFMVYRVGIVEYGLVGIGNIFAMSGYVSLLEMGFQSSISKYIAEFHAKGEEVKICRLVTSTLALFLGIGVVLMLIGLALSGYFIHIFKIPQEYYGSFRMLMTIIFISYLFQFPNVVYTGLFEGLQRFDIVKGVQTLTAVLMATGVLVTLTLGYNYVAIVACTVAALFIQFLIYAFAARKALPFLSIRRKHLSFGIIKEVWGMTKYLFVGKTSGLVYHQTPRLLIALFIGPVFMTLYEVIIRLPRFLKTMLGFINTAVMPAASELKATEQNSKLEKLFLRGMRYQIFFAFPVITGAMFLSEEFLTVWMGHDFSRHYRLLQFLLLWNLATPLVTYGASIFVGMNVQLRKLTILSIATTILSILISLATLRRYELHGIIAGYVLSFLLIFPFFILIYLREFKIRLPHFLKEIFIILAVALIPYVILTLFNNIVEAESLPILLAKGALWCACYWAALTLLVLNVEDRKMITKLNRIFVKS